MIPYGKHFVDEDDISLVCDVLRHQKLTQGPIVEEFEREVAQFCQSKFSVAVSSWTSGLHLACIAAGLQKGDYFLTTPLSFCASSNCGLYVGAHPVFSDINPSSLNLCPNKAEEKLKEYKGKIKAIILVHYSGQTCDMEAFQTLASKYNVKIIEDAAHALGSNYNNDQPVGSGCYSDIIGFSFHPVKSIACGEGGMICTNNDEIARQVLRLRSHGINKGDDPLEVNEEAYTDGILNPWYMEMQELGFNYRITDIQCALGVSQLKKLPSFIRKRKEIANQYDKALCDLTNVEIPYLGDRERSANHIYPIRIKVNQTNKSKNQIFMELKEQGILCQVHYIPIPMHPYYKRHFNIPPSDYAEAERFYREALTIPLYPSMTSEDIGFVINNLQNIVG